MNLHRTSGRPDWEKIKPQDRSFFQRLAVSTHGIISPANVITLIGFLLLVYGLMMIVRDEYWPGLVMLVIGRLLDVVDGMVAEATSTKSPLGEMFDAGVDKIGTLLTILILIVCNVAPWGLMAALVIPQVAISLVALYKKRRGEALHPTRPGKLSMATVWAGIAGILVSAALHNPVALVVAVDIVILVSCVLACYALWQYITNRG